MNLLNHSVMENVHLVRKSNLFHALQTCPLPENLGGHEQPPALTSGKKIKPLLAAHLNQSAFPDV